VEEFAQGQIMDIGQKFISVHLVVNLKSPQGCAINLEIAPAYTGDLFWREGQDFDHELIHPLPDGGPQAISAGIDRVVQVDEQVGVGHESIIRDAGLLLHSKLGLPSISKAIPV